MFFISHKDNAFWNLIQFQKSTALGDEFWEKNHYKIFFIKKVKDSPFWMCMAF